MARLTGLSMDLLSRIDAAGLEPFVENEDPVEFEADTFRRSLGLLYPGLLRWAGVRGLNSRLEIDQVAEKLRGPACEAAARAKRSSSPRACPTPPATVGA